MENYNVPKLDYKAAVALMDTIVADKKALDDNTFKQAIQAYANLSIFKTINTSLNALEAKILKYSDANRKEYSVAVEGDCKFLARMTSIVKEEWDADKLKLDAKLECKISCDETMKQYFKAPTAAVNPTACAAAGDEFKQKYSRKTTKTSTVLTIPAN